jgi:hypothetical protein
MADNVGYTEGSGKIIAADDVGGVLYQRVKPVHGTNGTAIDVSESNPMPIAAYGELIEAIESLRNAVRSISVLMPITDGAQRSQVNATVANASVSSVGTVSSVSTVSTVTTVSNVSQIASTPLGFVVNSWQNGVAYDLRRNITVT